MGVVKLKAPKSVNIEFRPSPKQYELWKLLQPDYCPHCGGQIEQVLTGYDVNKTLNIILIVPNAKVKIYLS